MRNRIEEAITHIIPDRITIHIPAITAIIATANRRETGLAFKQAIDLLKTLLSPNSSVS